MNDTSKQPVPVGELFDFATASVVVTGASRGIGAGIAARFAQAGASLVVNYNGDRAGAAQVTAEIQTAGGQAVAVGADVSTASGVEHLLERALAAFGHVSVWINNAGIYPNGSLLDMTELDWRAVIDTCLGSVHFGTQAAAKAMSGRAGGVIINIASIEALQPGSMHAHYASAKAAVVTHTRAAAQELGAIGVRVNAVSPGLIWREGLDDDWPDGVARYRRAAALDCLGTPNDVADACLFLASPAARWITGENLIVDGGVLTQPVF